MARTLPVIMPAWRAAAHITWAKDECFRKRNASKGARLNWFGSTPPTDIAIARWWLQAYHQPPRDWERLRDGIHGAGVPVDG